MIVCVSPVHYDESWNTLQYANRAKEIKTKVTRNVLSIDRHVGQYVQTISRLQEELAALKSAKGDTEKRWQATSQASRNRCIREVNEAIAAVQEACNTAYARLAVHQDCSECRSFVNASQAFKRYLDDHSVELPVTTSTELVDLSSNIQPTCIGQALSQQAIQAYNLIQANQCRKLASLRAEYPEIVQAFDAEVRISGVRLESAATTAQQACRATSSTISFLRLLQSCEDDVRQSNDHSTLYHMHDARSIFLRAIVIRTPRSDVGSTAGLSAQAALPLQSAAPTLTTVQSRLGKRKAASDADLRSSHLRFDTYSVKGKGVSPRTMTGLQEPKKQKKGVVWKDDKGQMLTEERAASLILDSSNASSDLSGVLPHNSSIAGDSSADLSRGSATRPLSHRPTAVRKPLDSLALVQQRPRSSLAGRSSGGTPRKTVSSTSRRVSSINVARSGSVKAQREIPYIDPGLEGTRSTASAPLRRASRTTASFEKKLQANAEEAARRRSLASSRTSGPISRTVASVKASRQAVEHGAVSQASSQGIIPSETSFNTSTSIV